MPALGYGTVCLCPVCSVHLFCCSVSSLRRTLLSSWWKGMDVALAHILAVLLLRGCCPLSSSPPSTSPAWWWCRPWFYPGLLALTYHCLRTGNWPLGHASLFVLLPSAAFPWDVTVGGSCMSPHFGMLSVLFPGNIGLHFFRISCSFLSNV